jgi:TIR domain
VDAFVSHSSHNGASARRLEKALEAQGLEVWLDDSEIHLGVLLGRELQSSIREAKAFVLLWSAQAAESRWVNAEWLTALHVDRFILPCVLDGTPLPQCLQSSVFLNLPRIEKAATTRLAQAIRQAPGSPTPLAPLMRFESPEVSAAITTLADEQRAVLEALGRWDVAGAARIQKELDPKMRDARKRWPLDPMIGDLDGYHLKNAYMVKHWEAIQSGRSPADRLLDRAERRFFETLWLAPNDPSALNGLGNILTYQRDLYAAEFFISAAIRAASKQGMASYPAAESDLATVRAFLPS